MMFVQRERMEICSGKRGHISKGARGDSTRSVRDPIRELLLIGPKYVGEERKLLQVTIFEKGPVADVRARGDTGLDRTIVDVFPYNRMLFMVFPWVWVPIICGFLIMTDHAKEWETAFLR